jgi:hypothetical protein
MAVPLKQLLADSKRLVARDLFDPANAEVTFTISSNDLPAFTLLATPQALTPRQWGNLQPFLLGHWRSTCHSMRTLILAALLLLLSTRAAASARDIEQAQ